MHTKQRSREIQRSIHQVLLTCWDPIGIRDEPNAQDEYEDYEGRVYRLLTAGGSDDEIAAFLHWVEYDRMGLPSPGRGHLAPVIAALRAIDVRP